jgi:hypothetical protein
MTSAKAIDEYQSNYLYRASRRDRLNFGDPGAFIGRLITRTMLPLRQVSDEFIYQFLVSQTVNGVAGECDLKFIKDSVDAGEIANICDPAVIAAYAKAGIVFNDWSALVGFLRDPATKKFLKAPTTYRANGFADLLLANSFAQRFFRDIIGAPEPGLYLPQDSGLGIPGVFALKALPNVAGGVDEQLRSVAKSQGLEGEDVDAFVEENKPMLVPIMPGLGRYLLSRVEVDGSFRELDVMGYVYDKIAAILVMGARGLPVEKYQELSMNGNMYMYPQTHMVASALYRALIVEDPAVSDKVVQTVGGDQIRAILPAAFNQDTKMYGLIFGLSDLVSDQGQEFLDKIRICTEGEPGCTNTLGLDQATFSARQGHNIYRATQTVEQDSIAFDLVSKGAGLSSARDQAVKDLAQMPALIAQLKERVTGKKGDTPADHRWALMNLLENKAPKTAAKVKVIYGRSKPKKGVTPLWAQVMAIGAAGEKADPGAVQGLSEQVPLLVEAGKAIIEEDLASDDALLKQVQTPLKLVNADMNDVIGLSARVVLSEAIVQQATDQLGPIEENVRTVRSILNLLGLR